MVCPPELVNKRLDYVKSYHSTQHYLDYRSMAKGWIRQWGDLKASDVSQDMIQQFVLKRSKVSNCTANKEIRSLRATFNFAKKRKLVQHNPVDGIEFLPEDKPVKVLPTFEQIEAVLKVADQETKDYLLTIRETLARVSEINQLTWKDVSLEGRYLYLFTRQKKGGHRTPRKIPMTDLLHKILSMRFRERNKSLPWVFWHRYRSRKEGRWVCGPYKRRKRLMRSLCKKAGVPTFQFHALRHFGASVMDSNNAQMGSIQRILGHESRQTTEIYLHSLRNSEREAMQIFEQAMRRKSHTGPKNPTQIPHGALPTHRPADPAAQEFQKAGGLRR